MFPSVTKKSMGEYRLVGWNFFSFSFKKRPFPKMWLLYSKVSILANPPQSAKQKSMLFISFFVQKDVLVLDGGRMYFSKNHSCSCSKSQIIIITTKSSQKGSLKFAYIFSFLFYICLLDACWCCLQYIQWFFMFVLCLASYTFFFISNWLLQNWGWNMVKN